MFSEINMELIRDILFAMPKGKIETFRNALERNYLLTTTYVLSWCEMVTYKEGFYLQFTGTRCSFSVYAEDRDGALVVLNRKPDESKLHRLFSKIGKIPEDFYSNLWEYRKGWRFLGQ